MKKPTKSNPTQSVDDDVTQSVIDEMTADLQRLQAEFINYKNRTDNEKQQLSHFATTQIVRDLLPVIDDLERALTHLPDELKDNKWAQGVQKVHARLMTQLEKMGIKAMDAINKPFDPNLHEAVQVEGDAGDQQIVSQVLQPGYMLGDTVIRHAIVTVKRT